MIIRKPEQGQLSWSNVINAVKISSTVLRKFPHIRISIPWLTNQARNWCNKIFIDGFSLLSNQYISNISVIYNPDVNLSLVSQTVCDHTFSDPKSDHIFYFIWLCTWFIFCFFLYVVIFQLLWRREVVLIYCRLIPNWIEYTQAIILFHAQYIMVIQNQIRNTTWRSISK